MDDSITHSIVSSLLRPDADPGARGGWEHETVLSAYEALVTFEDEERSIEVSASLSDGDLNTQVVAVAAAYAAG